jgi:3-isopropylmalate/(R)-2-methylmalate dehydratase small subunit
MKKITKIVSRALPLNHENIDTDQIIPAKFLKHTTREGMGKFFFHSWREMPDSIFHEKKYQNAKILIAGKNFGIGSSREHAVWATLDYGFEAIISSSFGDIFYNNSLKNGLIPVKIQDHELIEIFEFVNKDHMLEIEIHIEKEELYIPKHKKRYQFSIDPFRKKLVLNGVDELGYLLSLDKEISNYEKNHSSITG